MLLRIAQIKAYPRKGDLEANHRQLISLLGQIAEQRPDVVITPECFLDGYVVTEEWVTADSLVNYAVVPEDSRYVADVARWTSNARAWFILGCTRRAKEGAYNTALVFDRGGSLVGMYDKVHCQTHDRKFCAGDRLPVFDSDFGPFGIMICADRRWPETVRSLALGGARIIFNPTYGMCDARNLWMMQIRSYESEVWIAFTHPGQALVTGPRGEVVTDERAPDVPFVVSEIDLTEVDRVRAGPSAHLRDRRPDVYRL
jgi:omega-amidase